MVKWCIYTFFLLANAISECRVANIMPIFTVNYYLNIQYLLNSLKILGNSLTMLHFGTDTTLTSAKYWLINQLG